MLKTAECVSPRHPDKLCDQISDAILDAYLAQDPNSRVAIESVGSHGQVWVTGEVTSLATDIDIPAIVTKIAGPNLEIRVHVVSQSPEIAQGVDTGGAGDQGIMIGYATRETATYMPLEYELARNLCKKVYEVFSYDGKTQVTVGTDGEILSVVCSFQNAPKAELALLVESIIPQAKEYHINPAGDWNQGGFDADAGLTGRKIIVDNYGPEIAVGGGAFSGKDPSKVDRSGAYMARRIAVDYLENRPEANKVLVKLAYAIGHKEALMAIATVDGITETIVGYDLTPNGIKNFLGLTAPIYADTASWGHFGRGFSWK
ncbi:methionine adenosyltransferase [Candidatus Falkowbacteria bacterium CG10_big_fil_rev_8_21_14_0_10_37_18]|uniref:methionine adenosyltransferase n=1 Tax=Candidatus Falkowbacteria bacterium CG10_big_fil_rev_8_21_14_0_10_37_18 TaxID=1974562 RepID=A0A2H0V8P6_9BACT|nr:MAG: methionine adenosyltransferase [Candidatus Falkowbacteria bacterium CG10_big_fil_rev_8_21_14_0_10_37_18]